jgi:hypothetical protein
MYVLLFVSGENLTPVGYFSTQNSCLYAGLSTVFVEDGEEKRFMMNGEVTNDIPLSYLCVEVEGLLNK